MDLANFHIFSTNTSTNASRNNHTKPLGAFITALDTINERAYADARGYVSALECLPRATAEREAGYYITVTAGGEVIRRLEADFPKYVVRD